MVSGFTSKFLIHFHLLFCEWFKIRVQFASAGGNHFFPTPFIGERVLPHCVSWRPCQRLAGRVPQSLIWSYFLSVRFNEHTEYMMRELIFLTPRMTLGSLFYCWFFPVALCSKPYNLKYSVFFQMFLLEKQKVVFLKYFFFFQECFCDLRRSIEWFLPKKM